jgi:lysophospholipase L1-like esterase
MKTPDRLLNCSSGNCPFARVGLGILAALAGFLPLTPPARAAEDAAIAPAAGKIRIVLAGDSTVTDKAGWGKGFVNCLKDDVQCINLSKGGRSSKSFIAEGSWKKVLELKPDYVLIQFGHNDQPGHSADIQTDPQTTYRAFMNQYVDEARAAGIKPVLVTSLSRRQWGEDGKIHSTLEPNAAVVKEIAAEKKAPLIDLHARSVELYERLGKEKVLELSPRKNADPNTVNSDTAKAENQGYDGTHLNAKGSEVIGPIVAEELKKAVPELASHIK